MGTTKLEADYLVIGTGAVGMAFTDALIADSDASVVMIDRRHAPGGHWHDAYPFVRLHQPSAYYGVNSLPLGDDRLDRHGGNAGMLERASAPEICGYYASVMDHVLLPSGQVRHFPLCEHLRDNVFVSLVSGERYEVNVRKKPVVASYLQPGIPATQPPPFEVVDGVRCVPPNDLAHLAGAPEGYVVIGGGKTAIDTCLWLLEQDVEPARIRWIKPRESWLVNREFGQSGQGVDKLIEGMSLQLEAAAEARSIDALFERLEATKQLMRVDPNVEPTMYKMATVSDAEIALLRRIEQVVRLGHVQRITDDEIVLEQGTIPTGPGQLHVYCTAKGLNPAKAVPIFDADDITPQPIRSGLLPFNAAMVGYVEATRDTLVEKNRLCPTNALPDTPRDWLRGTLAQTVAEYQWSKETDIQAWLARSRLNAGRGLLERAGEPAVRTSLTRYAKHAGAAVENLKTLLAV